MISDDELYNLSLKFGICLFVLILVYGFISVNFLDANSNELVKNTTDIEEIEEDEKDIKQKRKDKK